MRQRILTLGNDVSHRHCKPKQAYSLGYTWDGGDSQAGTRGLGLQVTVSPLARVRPMLCCLDYLQESQCQGRVPCGALPGRWFTYGPRNASCWLKHSPQRQGQQGEVTKAGERKEHNHPRHVRTSPGRLSRTGRRGALGGRRTFSRGSRHQIQRAPVWE